MESNEALLAVANINQREEPDKRYSDLLGRIKAILKLTSKDSNMSYTSTKYHYTDFYACGYHQASYELPTTFIIRPHYYDWKFLDFQWSFNKVHGQEFYYPKDSTNRTIINNPFVNVIDLFEKKAESPIFKEIINAICGKCSGNISLHTSDESLNYVNDRPRNTLQISIEQAKKNPFFGRPFNKIVKNIKDNQINTDYLKLLEKVLEDKSKAKALSSDNFYPYSAYVQKMCNLWLDSFINCVSSLLFRSVKLRPSSSWELIWAIVSILWLSQFLDNCNLDIRGV